MLIPKDQDFEGILYSVSAENVSALHSSQSIEDQAESFLLAHFDALGIRAERGFMGGIGSAAGVSPVLQWFAENWEGAVVVATFLMTLFTKLRGSAKRLQHTARRRLIEPYTPSLVLRLQTVVRDPAEVADNYRSLVRLAPTLLDQGGQRLVHQKLSLILIDGSPDRYAAPLRIDASKFSTKEAHNHLKRLTTDQKADHSPLIYHQRRIFGIFRWTERVNDRERSVSLLFA